MTSPAKQDLLRKLPSVDKLLASSDAADWLDRHPRTLVVQCLRDALEELRRHIANDTGGRCGARHVTEEFVLAEAARHLDHRTTPHLRGAINATGILLHTGLGRSVWPECVVDSMVEELKGYVTLAVDRETGKRSDRDRRVEYILTELTGAEAATAVNNNAAATMLVLSALAAGRETIVSRGQLIEIGGAFRLPDVMAQSGSCLVEVGTTNRTHLADYTGAITEATAVILRVHPSNFRVVGFTSEVPLEDLVELAHARGLVLFDDLGAGALVDLARFGLPHEPTIQESIAAGADVVISSADKLIGAGQGGIIVGRKSLIERIRRHPLARAFRVDKTCLMALERTLYLFRDPDRLAREHPLYRMLATPVEALEARARALAGAVGRSAPVARTEVLAGVGYLGSGSLPTEQLPTRLVAVAVEGLGAEELARRLRMDEACVFARIENDRVVLDVRTIRENELPAVADAVGRAAQ
ncbi:MAG TPA: L-seryl-tRNA(Sec) selenium transferase [Phycisphaerae bacterium]|nr:L-seryl-tRNA(Sec) selenium transferase [Phycisphaerae bacterium]